MRRLAIAVAAMVVSATAGAQMYRWVDKDGKVQYTDTPPPASAKGVQKRSGGPAPAAGPATPYAVQQAAKNFPVLVYTSANCGKACADGKALLAARGVPYREISVGGEGGISAEEMKKATGSGDSVPVLMVGKSATRGFESETWHTALDSAGYPRSAPPLSAQAQKAAQAPAAPKAEEPKAEAPPTEPEKPKGPYAPK